MMDVFRALPADSDESSLEKYILRSGQKWIKQHENNFNIIYLSRFY